MVAEMAMVRKRPSLASARKPPTRASRLSVPMKLVTTLADRELERWRSPTRYVTRFMEMPITHTRSASSVPRISPAASHPPVRDLSAGLPRKSTACPSSPPPPWPPAET